MSLAYQDALDFLFGRLNYERVGMPRASGELRLGRMRKLLRILGDPHKPLRIIHIAGTKGKGSTANMVAAALSAAGFRTGLFTSPHLHRIEERIAVDGRPISETQFAQLVQELAPLIEYIDLHAGDSPRRPLTFFEITTAMGLLHFARLPVDVAVLEVGLGGRLDSTNIVRPRVAAITSISLDHTRLLGTTHAAIATEKAGILKRGVSAVSGVDSHEASAAIARIAAQRRARLRVLHKDFSYQHQLHPPQDNRLRHGRVRAQTWKRDWNWIDLPSLGAHQAANAATALAILDALHENEPALDVSHAHVSLGWSKLNMPARVEIASEKPWLIIDGAHNVASARALADTLLTHFPTTERTLIFGTSRDKDLNGQLRELLPLFQHVIATRYLENPRAVASETIAQEVAGLGHQNVLVAPEPAAALQLARTISPEAGLICVTGSLFLAAEARSAALNLPPVPRPSTALL